MPIDFRTGTNYRFPYREFFNMVSYNQIFRNAAVQKEYFSIWEEELKLIDSRKTEPFFLTDIANSNELFVLPVELSLSSYYLCHFHIKNLVDILQDNKHRIKKYRFNKYFMPLKDIYWTPVEDEPITKYKSATIKPVLLVPYPTTPYKRLIIDGNHRLSYFQKYQPNSRVEVCRLDINYLIRKNMFPSEFDKLLYIFINEIPSIMTQRMVLGFSDDRLLNSSYIVSGKWGGLC